MYEERIEIFKKYWNINRYSKSQQEVLMDYYEPIIRTRFLLGEPIIGRSTSINCHIPKNIIKLSSK